MKSSEVIVDHASSVSDIELPDIQPRVPDPVQDEPMEVDQEDPLTVPALKDEPPKHAETGVVIQRSTGRTTVCQQEGCGTILNFSTEFTSSYFCMHPECCGNEVERCLTCHLEHRKLIHDVADP